MVSSTSGTSVAVFTCLWIFVGTSADHHQISVKTGHDVTLQCLDPRGGDIETLEWTRLDPEEDVFVCRHGTMCDDDNQHESFKNRVKLMDPQMKNGNVSVILKNVTVNDAGTYECRVKSDADTSPQLIGTINLTVTGCGAGLTEDGGDKDEHVGLIAGLSVIMVLVVVVVIVYMIHRTRTVTAIFR